MPEYVHPGVPFMEAMPAGFAIGSVLVIHGMVNSDAQSFAVNLYCKKGVAFQLNPRFSRGYVVRNTLLDGNWGKEESNGPMPFSRGSNFAIKIVAHPTKYSVAVNDNEVFSYNYRYNDLTDIDKVEVKGDLKLTYVQTKLIATGSDVPTVPPGQVTDAGELAQKAGELAKMAEELAQKARELAQGAAELAQRQCADDSANRTTPVSV